MLKIPSEQLNHAYDDACWEWLAHLPHDAFADFSNMFDGCAFE